MKDYLLDTNMLGYFAEFRAGIDSPDTKQIKKYLNAKPKPPFLFISNFCW